MHIDGLHCERTRSELGAMREQLEVEESHLEMHRLSLPVIKG